MINVQKKDSKLLHLSFLFRSPTVLIDTAWPVNDGNSFKSSVSGGPLIPPLPIFPNALCINKFVADDDIDPDEPGDCPVNEVDD